MIIVLDTETTGLPKNYQAPVSDLENWPRAVQIAWFLCNNDGEILSSSNYLILPVGFEIPADATALHGITTTQAQDEGVPLLTVLRDLTTDILYSDWVVAHNMDYDANVLGAEFLRAGLPNPFQRADTICTMQASTEFCGIEGKHGGLKWPKLSELHHTLFGEGVDGEHDAFKDARATMRCFFALVERKVITLEKQTEEQTEEQTQAALGAPAGFVMLFSPHELQTMFKNANAWQLHARRDLFEAARALEFKKRELARLQTTLRMGEAFKALANDKLRDAYLAENCAEQIAMRDALEDAERETRLRMDEANAEMELSKAMLRIAELVK